MKTITIKIEEKEENKLSIYINNKKHKDFTRLEESASKYFNNNLNHIIEEMGLVKKESSKSKKEN